MKSLLCVNYVLIYYKMPHGAGAQYIFVKMVLKNDFWVLTLYYRNAGLVIRHSYSLLENLLGHKLPSWKMYNIYYLIQWSKNLYWIRNRNVKVITLRSQFNECPICESIISVIFFIAQFIIFIVHLLMLYSSGMNYNLYPSPFHFK